LNRRKLLQKTSAVLAATWLAGCSQNSDSPGETATSTPSQRSATETATATATETEVPDQPAEFSEFDTENADLLPIITESNHGNTTRFQVDVSDENGLDTIQAYYSNPYLDGRKQVAEKTVSNTSTTLTAELPQRLISPEKNSFVVEVIDQDGNTYTEEQGIETQTQSWKVDTPYSSYSTQREWDNAEFNTDIDELRTEWNNSIIYDGFTEKLENDEKLEPSEYASTWYPNADMDSSERGHWDLEAFKQETDFKTILNWIDTAVKTQNRITYDGPPSGHAPEMAASAERAIDEIHPEAETRSGYSFNPEIEVGGSHGTMIFYDENGESGWWHVDTTSENIVKPENAQLNRRDVWSPFTKFDSENPDLGGFHPGESQVENLSYQKKKSASITALTSLVHNDYSFRNIFISDEWLDSAYKHIRDDGDLETVVKPLESMVYLQKETEQDVGIYGDSLENTEMVTGELDQMYNQVMNQPEVMTADNIENMLEGEVAA